MGGNKYIVITNTKWIGGKNDFLAIIFLVVGILLFLIGLFMGIKNKRDPRYAKTLYDLEVNPFRILGDVRFLKWNRHRHRR